jgi:hypothetical protein
MVGKLAHKSSKGRGYDRKIFPFSFSRYDGVFKKTG